MAEQKSKYLYRKEDLPHINLTGDEKLPSMALLLLTDKMLVSFIVNPPIKVCFCRSRRIFPWI